jgi:hypothetical protein
VRHTAVGCAWQEEVRGRCACPASARRGNLWLCWWVLHGSLDGHLPGLLALVAAQPLAARSCTSQSRVGVHQGDATAASCPVASRVLQACRVGCCGLCIAPCKV